MPSHVICFTFYKTPQPSLNLFSKIICKHMYLLTIIAIIYAYSVLINLFSYILCLSCFTYKFLFIQSKLLFTGIYLNISYFNLFKYIIALGHSITVSSITHHVSIIINQINVLFCSCFTNKRKAHAVLGLFYKCVFLVVLINSNSSLFSYNRICTLNKNDIKSLIYAFYSLVSIFVLAMLSSFSLTLKFLYNYILNLFTRKTSCNYFYIIL